MVGAHQNLNGSHDLTTPLSGWFAIRRLALATISLFIKFEVYLHPPCRYGRRYKMSKIWWFGV